MAEKLSTAENRFADRCSEDDSVCIHANKIYDQCRDKDCLTDLRVYLTSSGQELVNNAISVKVRKAEILWIYSDIEAVQFNRGFYSVDLRYYFKITLDVFAGVGRPCKVEGLATFDKKVILYGSEGTTKVFSSTMVSGGIDILGKQKSNMPIASIEVVEPIALSSKVVEATDPCCNCCCETDLSTVPADICNAFSDGLIFNGDNKRVFVSLGIFSIVRLERSVQLLVPSYDFCIPQKECVTATDENPCDLFERIEFPIDEFFPPVKSDDCDCKPRCGCND